MQKRSSKNGCAQRKFCRLMSRAPGAQHNHSIMTISRRVLLITALLLAAACTSHGACSEDDDFDRKTGERCQQKAKRATGPGIATNAGHVVVSTGGRQQNLVRTAVATRPVPVPGCRARLPACMGRGLPNRTQVHLSHPLDRQQSTLPPAARTPVTSPRHTSVLHSSVSPRVCGAPSLCRRTCRAPPTPTCSSTKSGPRQANPTSAATAYLCVRAREALPRRGEGTRLICAGQRSGRQLVAHGPDVAACVPVHASIIYASPPATCIMCSFG